MKRKLLRWGIALLALLVLITPGLFLLNHWMVSSAEGSIHVGTPNAQKTATPEVVAPISITTSYFTTMLPTGFTVRRQIETPSAVPFQLQLAANTGSKTDQQFSATIGTMPVGGLTSLGDYNVRVTDTSTYAAATLPGLPAGAIAFRTVSGPAGLAIFWPHGSHYAELGFSTEGGATPAALQATYAQVLSAWNWK